jgi:oxygen-independent coproporphyrinogen-3 oxidase
MPQCEFTVEANPKTLNAEKIHAYKRNGVNRLSIGLQSIHENELKTLGRIHLYDDFLASYNLARKEGISNINVDLMYGIPEQSMDSFAQTLDNVLSLKPDHISLYGLILEEGTPLYKNRDNLNLPTEDCECDMYYFAAKRLSDAGYNHYEISNYAKPGCECRHNLKYWRCEEYIGVGVSAYSYFDGKRFDNSGIICDYLSSEASSMLSAPRLSDNDRETEFIMLALRLKEGISLPEFEGKFGKNILESKKDIIRKYVDAGLMQLSDNRLSLTERGFYVSNSIICEFI